jgi:hypothetical protein
MNIFRVILLCLSGLLPALLQAQPQIGGGSCNSSTLNGNYSLTLSGRDVSSAVAFSNALQGIGSANFDGLSKVTFTVTNNTNKNLGVARTLSGTYSLQSNCIGVVNITTGDSAVYTLGSYNQGGDFFIDGEDGIYSLLGSGSTLPSTCSASLLSGTYAFNGTGFGLNSSTISGVNQISGLLTFDGVGAVTTNWYVSVSGSNKNDTASGTFTVNSNCTATATVTDPSSNSHVLQFTITEAKGTNFLLSGANAQLIFAGSGRIL